MEDFRGFRAQAGLEAMLIFAAVLLMLLVVGLVLPSTAASGEHLRQLQLARQSVQAVASAADDVFLAGEGASKTIWVELPGGYEFAHSFIGNKSGVADWKNRKLADIHLPPSGDIFAVSRAPMCGNWPNASGRYRINLTYNATTPAHVAVNGIC